MTEYFFPNVSPDSLRLERRFRSATDPLDEELVAVLYEVLAESHEPFVPTTFTFRESFVTAHQLGCDIEFPRPLPRVKFAHLCCGYEQWIGRKYTLPGFVQVAPADVVVDCGAYVGGFSLAASRSASEVHAFEPEAANYASLTRNLADSGHVRTSPVALLDRTGVVELNVAASGVEHSVLTPDTGEAVEVRTVPVTTLAQYCRDQNLERIDFLKLEAEGVELEVVDGLGDVTPSKIAIDVSPERNGESPASELTERLHARGYVTQQRAHVLFARLD